MYISKSKSATMSMAGEGKVTSNRNLYNTAVGPGCQP
jgi:hypothetical protein